MNRVLIFWVFVLAGVVANAAPPIIGEGDYSEHRLEITGQLQFRYLAADSDGFGDESFVHGFARERTRVNFKGELGPKVSYKIVLEESSSSGMLRTIDAHASVELIEGLTVHIGQKKLPFTRELDVSSTRLLAVDRTPVERVFSTGRSEMVEFDWRGEELRLRVAASDGRGAIMTNYAGSREADFALTGRVEFKPFGSWSQFKDFSGFRGQDPGLLLGIGGHVQNGGETGGTADNDFARATVDIGYEGDGFNVSAAGHYQHVDTGADEYSDFGVLVQGGVFVSEQVEVFARYDITAPDDERPDDEDEVFQSITVGMNYFFVPESHAAKVTADLSWFPDAESESPVDPSSRTGILASDESQLIFRVQVQILF